MKRIFTSTAGLLMLAMVILGSCNKDNNGINIFTVEDDKQLGLQMQQEIQGNPAEYPLLLKSQYSEAYGHMERIRDSILATGLVKYDTEFEWAVHLIKNDTVLNAFCTPGGYIYFYTGIVKFLDNEAEFAGVMGHEMAHAANRHSTQQMTKAYGLQVLLSVVLGENPQLLAQMAADLAAGVTMLAFSRDDEYESDEYSVKYLYETSYDARGVAGFFEKMEGTSPAPEFLSTHPNPGNRVEKIHELWLDLGGKEGEEYPERYQEFKNAIP
ncbi:MAG: M48 family metalloprotease [Bacteroidales bacterium]|nr:M48 family metalloprotease [Bacteroidales bacterium]